MVTGKKLVTFADVESVINAETGDRTRVVVNAKNKVVTVELVGLNTAQLGQIQGFNYSYSLIIERIYYNSEKYCLFDNNLYEIKNISKSKLPTQMLLNVQKITDNDLKEIIERWRNANI